MTFLSRHFKHCIFDVLAVLIALMAAGLLLSCQTELNPVRERVSLKTGKVEFLVELAANDQDRTMGLMHRSQLKLGHGMLFIYNDQEIRSFWMKNTLIPLSIAFVDSSGTIIDIQDMQAHNLSSVLSSGPARFALEVKKGAFLTLGVKIGDRFDLEALNLP